MINAYKLNEFKNYLSNFRNEFQKSQSDENLLNELEIALKWVNIFEVEPFDTL
jgi:hypothetical protein